MSEICKNWSTWLKKTRFSYMNEAQVSQTLNWLLSIKDALLTFVDIKSGDKVCDFGCGSGLIGFGLLEKYSNTIEITFSDKFEDCIEECKNILNQLNTPNNVKFLQSDLADIKLPENYLNFAFTRSVLVHIKDKLPCFCEIKRVLKEGGKYCAFEPIIRENTRYYELLDPNMISDYDDFKKAEKEFMENPLDPLVNFNSETIQNDLKQAGFSEINNQIQKINSSYIAKKEAIETWFIAPPAPDQKTMKERFLDYFDEKKVDNFILEVINNLKDKKIELSSNAVLINAKK